jgi:predicted nucleotidyltransferase
MMSDLHNIGSSESFSTAIVDSLRGNIASELGENKDLILVAVGSIARKEASAESDLDYFIIHSENVDREELDVVEQKINVLIQKEGLSPPSGTGAFGCCIDISELKNDIGGQKDDTDHLTRRMLFLMESEWLSNKTGYDSLFEKVICSYVNDNTTQHALCRFILNDLIRYYRTVCVDFEFKTSESGKSWGDRNIKLAFARKMMYVSGVICVAETVQQTYIRKRIILAQYLKMTPVERIATICGDDSRKSLIQYDYFVGKMADSKFREMLRSTTQDRNEHCQEFRDIKNQGHHFSLEIANLLDRTYPNSHPIHQALRL